MNEREANEADPMASGAAAQEDTLKLVFRKDLNNQLTAVSGIFDFFLTEIVTVRCLDIEVPNKEEKQMRQLSIIALLILIPMSAISQDSYTQERTREIVASFSKEKHAVKEKNGVRVEKYKKVVSEPAVKQDIKEYSGVYEVHGFAFVINIQVGSDGSVRGTGSDPTKGNFRLEGAKITGAMLTATKVYEDGTTEKFEGVFINRTDYISPTDRGVRTFGLGVVISPVEFAGVTLDKLFYQLKQ
jgi:hypothetical protein